MAAFSSTYVIAPGIGNSDPGHWQTLWEGEFGTAATRVAVSSWDEPELEDWVTALGAAMTPGAVILAHSLGCLATIEWLARNPGIAAGAFLVAPPDPEGPEFPAAITGFSRPRQRLAGPMLVVGSNDDPYAGWDYTVATAATIGAPLVELDSAGHISTASGRGPWPHGRRLLEQFVAGLGA